MEPTDSGNKTPNANNGEPSGELRCRAKNCGRPQNPADPNRCLGGHPWKGNTLRGKSIERKLLQEEQQARVIAYRDQYLRDLGWDPPERAPLHTVHYCQFLAEALLTVEHTRQSKHAAREVASLLPKVQRLYSLFETFRRKPQDNEWGEKSLPEHLAELREMRDSCEESIRQVLQLMEWERQTEREREAERHQSALPSNGRDGHLGPLHTRVPTVSGANGPGSAVPAVAGSQIAGGSDLDPAPVSRASSRPSSSRETAAEPDSEPPPEPTPVLTVYGRRVTERDVRRCMADEGLLADYEAGRISKASAYARTASWIRNSMEFNPS